METKHGDLSNALELTLDLATTVSQAAYKLTMHRIMTPIFPSK